MNREHAERVYFEQVKRAVSIEAVLARYGIELKGRGGTLKGCCPIHNGSNPRQFTVTPNNGLWHCFGDCKRGGSIIEFVAAMEKVQPRDAALMIARWFAIESGTVISQHTERRRSTMSGEKPSHKVFVVEGEGDNAFWHRAGSAWPHKDGKGLNLQIPAGMALSGRVVLREYTDDDAKEEEQQKSSRRKK
jgi:hypothetical protein